MHVSNTKSVVESAFMTAIIIVLVVIGQNVPFLGMLATIIAPAILAIVGIRRGMKYSYLSLVTLGVVLSIISGPFLALMETMIYGVLGVGVGYGYTKGWALWKRMLLPSILPLIGLGIVLAVAEWGFGMHLADIWHQMQVQSQEMVESLLKARGASSADQAFQMKQLNEMYRNMEQGAVGLISVALVLITFVVTKVTDFLGRRLHMTFTPAPAFSSLQVPIGTAYVFCGSIILSYAAKTMHWPYVGILAQAAGFVAAVLLFFHGLALMIYMMDNYRVGKFARVLLVIVAVLYWVPWLIFGLIDITMNIRDRWGKPKDPKD